MNMQNDLLNTSLSKIDDEQFQTMIDELCLGLRINKEEVFNQSLFYLFGVMARENKAMMKDYFPIETVLAMKVNSLQPNSVLYEICTELARLNNSIIEAFYGKSVLHLIKSCGKRLSPKPLRRKRESRRERAYRHMTELIMSRRKNGSF